MHLLMKRCLHKSLKQSGWKYYDTCMFENFSIPAANVNQITKHKENKSYLEQYLFSCENVNH